MIVLRTNRLLLLAALVLVVLAAFAAMPGASAQGGARNGAGLVVRHGDGTLVYAYVEFDSETISGEEMLLRSGLDHVVAPYGGLGTGVCAINGEGCPADDCYCESFSSPAYYWHYYTRTDGGWATNPRGPSGHQLADGDIDGWSWTAGDHGLPPVTIEEVAAITGFDRSPDPTATPPLTPTSPPPAATATIPPPPPPTATQTSSPTPVPPTTTATSTGTATAATPTSTTIAATATATAALSSDAPTSTPSSTVTPTATPTAQDTVTPTVARTPTAASGAVIVRPGATPEALETNAGSDGLDERSLMLFGGFVALVIGAGGFAIIQRRRSAA